MVQSKKLIKFLSISVILGLIFAFVLLYINPNIGKQLGNSLYNQSSDIQSLSYAVAKAAPSVVNIYIEDVNTNYNSYAKDASESSASGLILSADGFIVTNYHVIPSVNEPNKTIWAQTYDGKVYQALIVGYDRRTDIALLKIEANNLPPIPIDKNYTPKIGDIVLAIGNPSNLGQTVTHGIVSATARTGTGLLTRDQMNLQDGLQELIQTDAPINQGNSGGALVNSKGFLVGMNTASFNNRKTGIYGIGFAIPTSLIQSIVNEILKHGRVIRGYLGISDGGVVELDNKQTGIRVSYVDPMGPAFGIIKENDIILKVNNNSVKNVKDLIENISSKSPGTKMSFLLIRDGKEKNVDVILTEDNTSIE